MDPRPHLRLASGQRLQHLAAKWTGRNQVLDGIDENVVKFE